MSSYPPKRNTDPSELGAVAALDDLVLRAAARGASDIHLEPKQGRIFVRMRVDGEMVVDQTLSGELAQLVVSRVKVLARMDIADRRLPQDGQLTLEPDGKRIHLRASTFPCSGGEKVVLRVLLGNRLIPFERLGMDTATQNHVRDVLARPQGFIVTSGPTGSGKTSTLYSFLQLIDTTRMNVMTLEDPIEVEIPHITQGQTHARAGFTFEVGLRAILRQDPDVILVGEMRDAETAAIALQAALTGHLVMSTLHTADTVETIVRLVDLGQDPWIIASALSCVLAQRLVRMVCSNCRETVRLDRDFAEGDTVILPAGTEVSRATGCSSCGRTGYRGRLGIFEALVVDDEIRDLIKSKAPPRAYRSTAAIRRHPSLRRIAFERVRQGVTTLEEVLRVA